VLTLARSYSWEFDDRHQQLLQFCVAESEEPYFKQLNDFRWRLFGGFAVMGLILMIAMLWLVRAVLRPLRQVENEILMIESGTRQQLSDNYPRELAGAASNMNLLLKNERERMERYRNSLGNLAHSLKTPLAVIRNLIHAQSSMDVAKIDEQVSVMDDIVRYQLKRAAVSAGGTVGAVSVALTEVIGPLVEALQKVYADKNIECLVDVDRDAVFYGDRNDLMEIAGNVLDNAFKYGHRKVSIRVQAMQKGVTNKPDFVLTVEDDGAGIPEAERETVMRRGKRLDEQQSGQGIGLSVVNELVDLYGGTISINNSSLGGAQVTIRFDSALPK
jgi:two-component system sensor histidine kinase PhoQ